MFDVGVLELERVKSECRLERLRRDEDEVEEERLINKAESRPFLRRSLACDRRACG